MSTLSFGIESLFIFSIMNKIINNTQGKELCCTRFIDTKVVVGEIYEKVNLVFERYTRRVKRNSRGEWIKDMYG